MDEWYVTSRGKISPGLLLLVYVYISVDQGARHMGAALGMMGIICLSDSLLVPS